MAAHDSHPVRAPMQPRLWLQAFVGFYRPQPTSQLDLDPIARFLYSARAVILVISVQASIIAGLLALTDRRFDPLAFLLLLVGLVVAHAISNLSNDYFGYRRGHDVADSPRMRYTLHPMTSGLDSRALLTPIAALGAIGLAIIVYFWALRGPITLLFAAAGVLLLFLYDAAPVPLKSIGLGELAAFLVWGPLMIGGGYFVIAGQLSAAAFLIAVPYGLGVASILVGKHIDQLDFDARHGQRTLPVVVGEANARRLNRMVVGLMYVLIAVLIVTGVATPFLAVGAVALPRAARAIRVMSAPRPSAPPPGYVGWPLWNHRACLVHNRLFGWVYIAGLALGAIVPAFRL
jgi:1,4-dihydroxy-2-naphthoate polyprenyltransferase